MASLSKYDLARLTFWAVRIKTLARARRLFADVPAATYLERPMFGHRFWSDVSRGPANQLAYLMQFLEQGALYNTWNFAVDANSLLVASTSKPGPVLVSDGRDGCELMANVGTWVTSTLPAPALPAPASL